MPSCSREIVTPRTDIAFIWSALKVTCRGVVWFSSSIFFNQPRDSDRAVGSIAINQVIGEVVPDLQHHLAIRRCFDLAFVRHHFGKVPVSIAYLKQQSIFAC